MQSCKWSSCTPTLFWCKGSGWCCRWQNECFKESSKVPRVLATNRGKGQISPKKVTNAQCKNTWFRWMWVRIPMVPNDFFLWNICQRALVQSPFCGICEKFIIYSLSYVWQMRYTKFELKALKNAIKRQVGKARYSHREVLLAPISCIENPFTVRLISRSHREEVLKQRLNRYLFEPKEKFGFARFSREIWFFHRCYFDPRFWANPETMTPFDTRAEELALVEFFTWLNSH